jgi:uncharacterized protein YgiM (DUF1202 family)
MGRFTAAFGGILLLTLLAAGLTEATLAIGRSGSIVDDTALRTSQPSSLPAAKSPAPSASPSESPSAIPTPTPTPTQTATNLAATTNSFVHLRSSSSTSSQILLNLNGGTVVQLLSGGDSQWQEVDYNGTVGYVFKSYLTF